MAEESKRRFEAVMDKLFRAPPKSKPTNSSTVTTSNATGVQWSRGKKRPHVSSALSIGDPKSRGNASDELQTNGSGEAASCRPWDRDDLFRRFSTFKSMTWFAKPQAVSAINCARRGWVNIDMDIIACESCRARLLFSTPSSWTQQQVEKAALVFSLKLDSGHKLLCPWVDNTCDETLAQFPAKPTDVLVEDYKNRCSALLQLSALPVISSLAVDYMRSPQLQQFLKGSSGLENNESADACRIVISETQSASSAAYYQAQKLISLCGWEPHSLPYTVDCKFQEKLYNKDVNSVNQSNLSSSGLNLNVYSSADGNKEEGGISESNSVALSCKLCGATVGLWAFSSVPRPLEFLRLVGYTEVDGKSDTVRPEKVAAGNINSGNENPSKSVEGINTGFAASTSSNDKTSNLNLTIAGGPPPAEQNYRATISLPVIGRNLRVRFSMDSFVGKDQKKSVAVTNITSRLANQIGEPDPDTDNPLNNMQVVAQGSGKEPIEAMETVYPDIGSSYRSEIGTRAENDIRNGNAANENNAAIVVRANDKQDIIQGERQSDSAVEASAFPLNHKIVPSNLDLAGKNLDQLPFDKSMEFDPIRQHRLFCPWIASNVNSAPGWQQTLSALQRHKKFSYPLSEDAASSLIEVDDPITSVRKLFSSPPAKRTKHAPAS